MRMARQPHLAVFVLAAVHLLLFSICPISGRIYQTNDAVVIEVDDASPNNLANRHFENPPPTPMTYGVNPFTGFYYQQQLIFPFWPYPLSKPEQKPACGAGPASPPERDADRIVGGTEAIKNSWPFIVGLRINAVNGGKVMCGGSIISTTRILTAAHCVNALSALQISTMTVSLGMHTQGDGNTFQNDAQQTRRITRVVYHKDYNDNTLVNDIAILTMDPPISYSKAMSPICLPPASTVVDQFVDKDAAVMGWGLLKHNSLNGTQPNALQQATVKIDSYEKCRKFWFGSHNPVSSQQICASADRKDTCQGDSGGPMVVQAKAGSTAWTQVGIASFGLKCSADSTKPSVYASVAFFRKWIDTYMKD